MIIGNGLLAKSLIETNHEQHTLFCSGVSDSTETLEEAFRREHDLLLAQQNSRTLFYFSTISIFNPSKAKSPYILHKIAMEALVKNTFHSSLIVRLPNMVGLGGNERNLFPFFLQTILQGQLVKIHRDATRFLLDIDDFPKIVGGLMEKQITGEINICYSNPAPVAELYSYMCDLLGKQGNYVEATNEISSVVDNQRFLGLLEETQLDVQTDWKKTIEKQTLLALHTG